MKKVIFLAPLTLICAIGMASSALSATICGVVRNAQGQGVSGAQVTAKGTSGQVLGQTASGGDGSYKMSGIQPGTVDLFLDNLGTTYKPGSGVLDLTEPSRAVNWETSGTSPALAASSGLCEAAAWTDGEIGSVVLLGAGLGGAIGVTVWAATSDLRDHRRSRSPQD